MIEKIALHYLLDLQDKLSERCGFTDQYTDDELEALIEQPEEHLADISEKIKTLIKSSDKEIQTVYYGFYYQGQIDGILELFKLKNFLDERKQSEKH